MSKRTAKNVNITTINDLKLVINNAKPIVSIKVTNSKSGWLLKTIGTKKEANAGNIK